MSFISLHREGDVLDCPVNVRRVNRPGNMRQVEVDVPTPAHGVRPPKHRSHAALTELAFEAVAVSEGSGEAVGGWGHALWVETSCGGGQRTLGRWPTPFRCSGAVRGMMRARYGAWECW